MTIKSELRALQARASDGILRVETIHSWAKSHPRSALYKAIEWNVDKAAQEYQFWQIRRLVQIHVVSDDGAPQVVSLVIDRSNGGGYRSISDVVTSKKLSAMMLADALAELQRTQIKYQRVSELTSVWEAVGRVRKRSRPRDSKGARASA